MRKSNKVKSAAVARKREARNRRQAEKATNARAAVHNARTGVSTTKPYLPSYYAIDAESSHRAKGKDAADNSPESTSSPPPNFGLSTPFLEEIIQWQAPTSNRALIDGNPEEIYVQMKRDFNRDSLDKRLNCFVAYNRDLYAGPEVKIDPELSQAYWDQRLGETWQVAPDFVKSGPNIWDNLGLKSDPKACEFFLHMKEHDEDVSRAFHAALFSAVNTSSFPADWEGIILAIATFIHAHPAFAHLVSDGHFHQPFGEKTGWRLLRMPIFD